jgi:hypothetical protein
MAQPEYYWLLTMQDKLMPIKISDEQKEAMVEQASMGLIVGAEIRARELAWKDLDQARRQKYRNKAHNQLHKEILAAVNADKESQ